MKKLFTITFLLTILGLVVFSGCNNFAQWKKAYTDFIRTETPDKDANGKELKYALVKLDNDDIPELLYSGEGYVNTHLCWIQNDKIKHKFVSNEDFLYYEKKNLFYGFYFNHGVAHEMVYTLENNELNKLFENTYDLSGEKPRYLIGKKVVSKAEHEKSVDMYFIKSKAATVNYCNGKNEIVKLIEDY